MRRLSFPLALRAALAGGLAVAALLPGGCERGQPKKPPQETPAAALKLVIADDPGMAKAIRQLQGEWKAHKQGGFEVAETTEAELLASKSLSSDAVIYPSYCLGTLAERGLIAPLPRSVLAGAELDWRDVFETIQLSETAWGRTTYAVPFGSPLLTFCYRADLFERFKRRPPETWTEYQELAEFFGNREKLGDAAPEAEAAWSGTIEPLADGWASRTLLARAAAYAKHHDNYSTLFNVQSMEPLIAGPPFVRALEELVAAAKAGNPDQLKFTPEDVRRNFFEGRSAMALTWPSAAHESENAQPRKQPQGDKPQPSRSLLPHVQFEELPGSEKVYNTSDSRWEKRPRDEAKAIPLLAIAGRLGSVSRESAQPEAASRLLAWLSGSEWGTLVGSASRSTTLYRASQLRRPGQWVEPGIDPKSATQYAEAVERSLSRPVWLFALRLPGREEYLAALDKAVQQAVRDGRPAAEALNDAVAAWREITGRLGLEAQRLAYARSLGLEP